MEKTYRPRDAALLLGVSIPTLQRWDREGKLHCLRLPSGRRSIPESEIQRLLNLKEQRVPALYARVSSFGQKPDLEKQLQVLQQQVPGAQVFSDIKSGLNFKRPGLQKLLTAVMENKISTIYITYEDRLARFGFSLIEWLCQQYRTDIHVLYEQEPETPHEELAKDLVSIVTSFSARLYGLRSHKTKRLLQTLKEVENDPSSPEMEVV